MVMKIQVMVLWVISSCSDMVGPHHALHPEEVGIIALQNIGILPHHCMGSQPRRPQH